MADSNTQRVKFEKKYCPKCYGQYEQIDVCPEDGTALRGEENDPLIGKVFAERYVIQSIVGLGGMSIVYKAQHKLMDRVVAIKMLHSNIKNDHTSLERFRMEAQAASSLNHQNIITVYDFGVTDQGDAFFVMDFLEGESLAEMLERKGKIPYERALGIFKQICDGLGAAHKKSIVHRDLKPANVILLKQDDGTELVKLVDFGIAKMMPGGGKQQLNLTRTGEVFGSPIYMSPEQCQGLNLDKRSDIYALGCLMYEVITGVPPLVGNSFLETLNMHVTDTPKPIAEIDPEIKVPPALEQIIFSCMAKNADDRPQNTEEIRDQLSALTLALSSTGAGRAQISGPVPSVPCPAPSTKVNRYVVIALAISITALAASAGYFFFYPGPPEDLGTPATKQFWSWKLDDASQLASQGKYADAEKALLAAQAYASTLYGNGRGRLETTLKQKADLYSKWEGHAELLEKTNKEIIAVVTERTLNELKIQYESLNKLDSFPTDSSVAQTDAKLKAEAEVSRILLMAGKLNAYKLYLEQVKFLEKALQVERKLLGKDALSVVLIENSLVDAYQGMRNFPPVRPVLLHICSVYEKDPGAKIEDYIRALARLGQFDLDQNQLKDAESELKKALDLGREKKVNKELRVLLMRGWADLLNQTNRKPESQEVLKQAATLEKSATDLPAGEKL